MCATFFAVLFIARAARAVAPREQMYSRAYKYGTNPMGSRGDRPREMRKSSKNKTNVAAEHAAPTSAYSA